jgi:hypothetical protein
MNSQSLLLVLLAIFAVNPAFAASSAQQSFEQLRSLEGQWKGTSTDGPPVEVDYRLTSRGSAMMSEIKGKEDMISMFTLDGDRILLTHYCAVGNQPRMVASSSPDGKTLTFDFLDATNLAAPDAGHMARLILSMADANHHTEEWVFIDHGREHRAVFDLQRAK